MHYSNNKKSSNFDSNKTYRAPTGSEADGASFDDIFREEHVKEEWVLTLNDEKESEILGYLAGLKEMKSILVKGTWEYICYMAIRLIEMRRILKPTGSLYLHCDPTMSHYLKILLDCIFGSKNFVNEVIWKYNTGGASKKSFSKKHDVVLFYAKNKRKKVFNIQREAYREEKTNHFTHEEDGRKVRIRKHGDKEYKYFLDEGRICHDVWNIDSLNAAAKERRGYPTQKPLALLERIIKASSNEGDVVLDPFCGCATTCVAAEKLGRQWIGIDVSKEAYNLVKLRINEEVNPGLDKHISKRDIHFREDIPHFTAKEVKPRVYKKILFGEQEGRCKICNRAWEYGDFEVDHIVSRNKGGRDHAHNLQLLCTRCNRKKGRKFTNAQTKAILRKEGLI